MIRKEGRKKRVGLMMHRLERRSWEEEELEETLLLGR